MGRKSEFEIPSNPSHGELCEETLLPCLHEGEARKEAKRIPSFQGNIHQALPHRLCGWWHIYAITPKRRSLAERKKDAREERTLREKIERGFTDHGE